MKQGEPRSLSPAEQGDEAERQKQRPQPFQKKSAHQGVAHHPHHPGGVGQVQGGGHHQALGQANAPPQGQRSQGHQTDKTQSADLEQQQNHPLAEGGPVQHCVHLDQTGDAGGGGGGKETDQQGSPLPTL